MTDLINGMSGGERGGGSVFKQGDAVWVPLYVAGERGDGVLMAANPAAAKAGRGSAVVMRSEVLPYCDALPAVARWLSEWPGMPEVLASMRQDLADLPQWKYSQGDGLRGLSALISALGDPAALTGGEGAGSD